MAGSIDPRCETVRGTHWPKPGRVVVWNSRRGNHLGQRSKPTASTGRTYGCKRSDHTAKPLVPRGPSTYGSRLSQGRRSRVGRSRTTVWALRRGRHHAVAAIVWGAVERGVGALEHVGNGLAFELKGRQPDRDRALDAIFTLVDREGFAGDRTAQPFGHHARDMQVRLRHHDHKFLTAIAAGQIDAADRLAHPHGEFAQYVVAGVVAVSVVDRFEKIDVEHHQRQRLAAGRGLLGQ